MGRVDDVINVAGHRLSTGGIEAVLTTHPAVAECAMIGVADEIKGEVPRAFVVLKSCARADDLPAELVKLVRDEIGAVACLKLVDVGGGATQDTFGQDPAGDRARQGHANAVDERGSRRAARATPHPPALTAAQRRPSGRPPGVRKTTRRRTFRARRWSMNASPYLPVSSPAAPLARRGGRMGQGHRIGDGRFEAGYGRSCEVQRRDLDCV